MPRLSKYTEELLRPIVKKSISMAAVLRHLGLKPTGGNYRNISKHILNYGISTEHFKGQGWSNGLSQSGSSSIESGAIKRRTPDSEVFKKNSSFAPSRLKDRLVKIGWKYECSNCGLKEWLGVPIRLHVDHINGEHTDHRLCNLRFLCPNCHQQTATWGNSISPP